MTPKSDPPSGPVSVESLPWEPWGHGVRFGSRVRVLSNTHKTTARIGIAIEELEPGKQSAPFHYHMIEEEHLLMLEGEATLRLGEQRYPLKAGDYVCFPAGRPEAHCLINESAATCRFLMIGDNSPNEVCVYPDSDKVQVRSLGRAMFRRGDKFDDYWAGENADTPLP